MTTDQTPPTFADGGVNDLRELYALQHAITDAGGELTRPVHRAIDALREVWDRELRREQERRSAAPVPPPADQTALRDSIAEALANAHRTHPCPVTGSQYWTGCYHPDGTSVSCHTNRRTDAVLAVLPPPADRAAEYEEMSPQQCPAGKHPDWAVDSEQTHACPWCEIDRLRADRAAILRDAADQYAKLADQNEAYELAEHGSIDHESRLQYEAVRDVVAGLRRMADETATTETGCWCGHPEDRHWTGATDMTFTDGCHDCRGWNGAHVYGQELPWLSEGDEPAAGARQDGARP